MATIIRENSSQAERAISTMVFCVFGGCLVITLFALQTSSLAQFFSVFGVGVMIAGASVLSGGLLGFLFGIPRTLQQSRPEGSPSNGKEQEKSEAAATSYQANTNLEQISDWLTKILVGVGLTQVASVPGALQRYAEFVAPGLGGFATSGVFGVTILVFFLICGFLASYLWTRLHFAGALRQADIEAVGDKIAQVESKVSELEKQAALDAKALSLAQRQLNPTPDAPSVPPEQAQKELDETVRNASSSARAQVFYLAQSMRSANWRDRQTKPKMERTIPIFRALVASDKDDVYHANHGQLGFALKDQRKPDWKEAEHELTKAIEIRGPWEEQGWLFYEYNRALCRIGQDKAFNQSHPQPTDASTKQAILSDLKVAANASDIAELIPEDPTISKWLEVNDITWSKVAAHKK